MSSAIGCDRQYAVLTLPCKKDFGKTKAPGSVLLFYRSRSQGYLASQSITSVGIVETVTNASSLDELVRITVKRSV
jgi:hypothetical protein